MVGLLRRGGLAALQILLLLAGHAAGALVARSRGDRAATAPAVAALAVLLGAAIVAVSAV